MAHAFRLLNVFTDGADPFSGNPLCVIEDGHDLSAAQMQAIARQFNLSETTFILPANAADATVRVRIFTPTFEMPFAGHPSLGTAHVVRALRGGGGEAAAPIVLELIAGLVPVTVDGDAWTLRAARAPITRPVDASRAELASMVGLPVDALAADPLWVDTGTELLVIPVTTAAHVRAARPEYALISRWGFSATRDEAMPYEWAPDRADDELVVRFFFTSNGAVIEDPATGSACANLGGWLVATGTPLPLTRALRQGDAVGRPSRLGLRVAADRGIYVTGTVIELGRGSITV